MVIALLPTFSGWSSAVPELAAVQPEQSTAPAILADLSSDLNAIAVAIIVGSAIVMREWGGMRSRSFWISSVLVVSAAIASCYAGFRFRFALAEQISIFPMELSLIGDRLATQGLLLLGAVCGLLYMALRGILDGDPRKDEREARLKRAPRKRQ